MLILPVVVLIGSVYSSVSSCVTNCDDVVCSSLRCTNTFTNECDCCPKCVQAEGQECDEDTLSCGHGLECVNSDDIFQCQNESAECNPELCDVSVPVCIEDSHLVLEPPSDDKCCPEARCECDYAMCETLNKSCPQNTKKFLLRKGSNVPGMCCDQFECRQPGFHCGRVRCSIYQGLDLFTECPSDSFRPEAYIPEAACCPIYPDCKCKGSVCPPVQCNQDEDVVIIRRGTQSPGSCCDIFECRQKDNGMVTETCTHDGRQYLSGEQWNLPNCRTCWCDSGVSLCKTLECPVIAEHCTWIEIPDGECCPQCQGCTDEFGRHNIFDVWIKDDCTNCTCGDNFKTECVKPLCKCGESTKPGKCCTECEETTVCPSLLDCELRCQHGFEKDDNGCDQCICASESVIEDVVIYAKCEDQSPCEKSCFNGFQLDSEGCYTCECLKCPLMNNCKKKCLFGYKTNEMGCSICKCKEAVNERNVIKATNSIDCKIDDHIYKDSAWWSDSCRQCLCTNGRMYCSALSCTSSDDSCEATPYNVKKGECCPSCSQLIQPSFVPCNEDGDQYVDGETVEVGCYKCICALGHVLCSDADCDKEYLLNSFPNESSEFGYQIDCIDYKNKMHVYNDTWTEGNCRLCQCQLNGTSSCVDIVCPEVNCDGYLAYLDGQCCPVCIEKCQVPVCEYNDVTYYANEVFSDGLCRNCTCTHYGNVECTTAQCPACERPVYVPFECCPTCSENVLFSSKMETEVVVFEESGLNVHYATLALTLLIIVAIVVVKTVKYYRKKESIARHTDNGYLISGTADNKIIYTKLTG
ncbi:unnamed protein product [Bursaphelenchus okinawaensis]|uniref:Cysteine-rich motor neuron 1 protein n=1 Tax=Bursaphelenchus okinawaensis TaxID=465554 RepID=A0A811L7B0_9BILA|nr:unnamed protein product [Bursaphelenchus okinawaensis]CAG9119641.1 unnamed protein product [Bursaphelenchus okinawaensis]